MLLNYFLALSIALASAASHASEIKVSQSLWQQFSTADQMTLLTSFPGIELVESSSVGTIQGVQSVNRSMAGTNTGAMLGGAIGGAAYLDRAFRGDGGNYSALVQLGATLLGAAVGSTADSKAQARFEFNYSIKTLDGQIREIRNSSSDEFTKPVGQCVLLPSLVQLAPISCSADKPSLLKALAATKPSHESAGASSEAAMAVACKISGVGVMTLGRRACQELEGVEQ